MVRTVQSLGLMSYTSKVQVLFCVCVGPGDTWIDDQGLNHRSEVVQVRRLTVHASLHGRYFCYHDVIVASSSSLCGRCPRFSSW